MLHNFKGWYSIVLKSLKLKDVNNKCPCINSPIGAATENTSVHYYSHF